MTQFSKILGIITLLALVSATLESAQAELPASFVTHDAQHRFFITVSDNQQTEGAKNFVDTLAKRGIGFLSNEALTPVERKREFRALLQDGFDMKTIARFSLGRYYRTATKAQKREYFKLFEDMVIDVYSKRFGDYDGQGFEVRNAIVKNKTDSIVSSYIVQENGQEIQVDWRVRYKESRYKVIDVIVEGVSMAVTQRSDFASVIQRGGGQLSVLLNHLKKR